MLPTSNNIKKYHTRIRKFTDMGKDTQAHASTPEDILAAETTLLPCSARQKRLSSTYYGVPADVAVL